jgi:ADP-ribose pyrophosphatase YjhB (NUDIX family)
MLINKKRMVYNMNKFKEIRPIVLGLAVKNNKLLVSEGFDSVKNLTFYRCLGGGIEFLEKSEVALKREFLEEINKNITIKDFLGISESIFTYEGKRAHELILFYSIELSNEDFQEEYKFIDNNRSYTAKWVDIKDFKDNKKILYPEEVLKYI